MHWPFFWTIEFSIQSSSKLEFSFLIFCFLFDISIYFELFHSKLSHLINNHLLFGFGFSLNQSVKPSVIITNNYYSRNFIIIIDLEALALSIVLCFLVWSINTERSPFALIDKVLINKCKTIPFISKQWSILGIHILWSRKTIKWMLHTCWVRWQG